MVAASFLDGFWEFDLKEWDVSAGELILKEAGGKVFKGCVEGHTLFVCGNPDIHDKLLLELEAIAKI
jgi:myo-inositol-1(or 4)-monophosphatase